LVVTDKQSRSSQSGHLFLGKNDKYRHTNEQRTAAAARRSSTIRVCVQLPSSAENETPPAFAAERRAAAPLLLGTRRLPLSINISRPHGAQQQTRRTLRLLSSDGTDRQADRQTNGETDRRTDGRTDRQTDGRTVARPFHRPCSHGRRTYGQMGSADLPLKNV